MHKSTQPKTKRVFGIFLFENIKEIWYNIYRRNKKEKKMVLTAKQEECLKVAVARYRAKEPWTCIAGFAGAGKTTVIRFIISALGLNPEDIAYVAYTGKAANVLKQKGCINATTAHKLIFESRPLPNGGFVNIPRTQLEENYKLIVIDEISMLPKNMWNLLLKYKVHILALGDPFQLPPISADDDNQVLNSPHVFLDEIMRQAKESEIIRLSMHIREGKDLGDFPQSREQVQIFSPSEIVSGMYEWADQVICATNRKRIESNTIMRKMLGRGEEPEPGDKIISLTNHWDCFSLELTALTNGSIGQLKDFYKTYMALPTYIYPQRNLPILRGTFVTEDGETYKDLFIDYQALSSGQKTLTPRQEYQIYKSTKINHPAPFDFTYGYAITCWKAQGSQWDKVMLFEERFPFVKEEHARYLYTGITRAADKLIVIKEN